MRRRITWPDGPPPHLQKFRTSDWDTDDTHAAFELWVEACKSYLEVHGWPGGPAGLLRLMRDTRMQLGQEAPE